DLMHLETLFARVPLANGSVVTLTDSRGLVLARSRDADRYIGTTMEVARPAEAAAPPRTSAGKDIDGVERLFAAKAVDRGGWAMTVGIPRSEVAVRLWPLWRRNALIALV